MIGSAAAALTGLMFVVVTLVYGEERVGRDPRGISTFSTPNVLHFAEVLFVAAVLSAPWRTVTLPGLLLGIGSAYGMAHLATVTLSAGRLATYTPDIEDWIWYAALPLLTYAAILAGAVMLFVKPVDAMFAFGAGAVVLIFIGIHNAWDVVTFLALGGPEPPNPKR